MKQTILVGAFALGLLSCGTETHKSSIEDDELNDVALDIEETSNLESNMSESLLQTLNSIPSPIETAFQIQENGGEYNKNYLNEAEKQDQYNTSSVQALNLGVYSADLAYINIYKSNDVLDYLGAVSRISEDLGIGEYFNLKALSQLVKHDDNLDSLLQMTTDNFEEINKHLQEEEQSHLAVLMLTGGWLEGLHLILEVFEEKPSQQLRERIGEQQVVLSQLVPLLTYYNEKNKTISDLHSKILILKDVYNGVEIKRTESDVVDYIFEDGIRIAVPRSSSEIIITDDQIREIKLVVNQTRKSIVN
jgi:hypothetical protein